jgi:hypothetical protein
LSKKWLYIVLPKEAGLLIIKARKEFAMLVAVEVATPDFVIISVAPPLYIRLLRKVLFSIVTQNLEMSLGTQRFP